MTQKLYRKLNGDRTDHGEDRPESKTDDDQLLVKDQSFAKKQKLKRALIAGISLIAVMAIASLLWPDAS